MIDNITADRLVRRIKIKCYEEIIAMDISDIAKEAAKRRAKGEEEYEIEWSAGTPYKISYI